MTTDYLQIELTTARYLPIIEIKAKHAHIYGMEPGDLVSELWIALIKGIGRYEGRRGASELTFVKRILDHKLIDLSIQAKTKKRKIPTFSSLSWNEDDL